MPKGGFTGVGGVARKTKKAYIGVNGVARKTKKAYIGVNGVARLCYVSEQDLIATMYKTTNSTTGKLVLHDLNLNLVAQYNLTSNEIANFDYVTSATEDNNYVLGVIDGYLYTFSYMLNSTYTPVYAKIAKFQLNGSTLSLVSVLNFQPTTKLGGLACGAVIINDHIIIGTCAWYDDEISASNVMPTGTYKYDKNFNLIHKNEAQNYTSGFKYAGDALYNNEFIATNRQEGGYSSIVAINFDTLAVRVIETGSYVNPQISVPAMTSGRNAAAYGIQATNTNWYKAISAASPSFADSLVQTNARYMSLSQVDGRFVASSITYYEYWYRLYKYANQADLTPVMVSQLNTSDFVRADMRSAPTPNGYVCVDGTTIKLYNDSSGLVKTVNLPEVSPRPVNTRYVKL